MFCVCTPALAHAEITLQRELTSLNTQASQLRHELTASEERYRVLQSSEDAFRRDLLDSRAIESTLRTQLEAQRVLAEQAKKEKERQVAVCRCRRRCRRRYRRLLARGANDAPSCSSTWLCSSVMRARASAAHASGRCLRSRVRFPELLWPQTNINACCAGLIVRLPRSGSCDRSC